MDELRSKLKSASRIEKLSLIIVLFTGVIAATIYTAGSSTVLETEINFSSYDYDTKTYGISIDQNGSELLIHGPFVLEDETYYTLENNSRKNSKIEVLKDGKTVDKSKAEKIKGVRNLYRITKIDPLFYRPHSPEQSFEQYENYEQEIIKENHIHNASILNERNLVANRFLKSLDRTENTTHNFYEETSYENGIELVESYESSSDAYEKDLVDLIKILNSSRDTDRSREIIGFVSGKQTSLEIIFKDLNKISENSAALREDVEGRRQILMNNRDPKITLDQSVPNYSKQNINEVELMSEQKVKDIFHTDENMSRAFLEEAEIAGPYRIQVPCYDEHHYVVRLDHPKAHERYPIYKMMDANGQMISFSNKNDFNESYRDDIIYEDSYTYGYKSGIDMAFLNCNCAYVGNSAKEWNLINQTVSDVEQKPLFQNLESSELDSSIANDISIGAESEKVFLNSPNYQNAQVLKKRYMNAYKIIETASKDNDLSSETLNIADKMRERSLKISSEIAFSHNPLKNYNANTDSFREIGTGEPLDDPGRLMPTDVISHSYYYLTFGPESDSIW